MSKKSTHQQSKFRYATPTTAFALMFLGFVLWPPLFGIGVIFGMVWFYRFSKGNKNLRILWWILLTLLTLIEILITEADLQRFY